MIRITLFILALTISSYVKSDEYCRVPPFLTEGKTYIEDGTLFEVKSIDPKTCWMLTLNSQKQPMWINIQNLGYVFIEDDKKTNK